jgi:hypothetical protein
MIVFPSLCNSVIIHIISFPVCESKAPVGSSANIIEGLITSALAIETLCCSPPDNSLGLLFILCQSHTLSNACIALFLLSVFMTHS